MLREWRKCSIRLCLPSRSKCSSQSWLTNNHQSKTSVLPPPFRCSSSHSKTVRLRHLRKCTTLSRLLPRNTNAKAWLSISLSSNRSQGPTRNSSKGWAESGFRSPLRESLSRLLFISILLLSTKNVNAYCVIGNIKIIILWITLCGGTF